jgi:predicted RNase H-like nuclease (RuvC/YqgF family)
MKFILLPAVLLLLGTAAIPLYADPSPEMEKSRIQAAGQLREAMTIRRQMRTIEEQTVKNDPELKKISDDLQEQFKAFRKQVEIKLQANSEYQDLKTKIEKMREDLSQNRERWPKRESSPRR